MNKRAKSSRKRMQSRIKWGRGGLGTGGRAPETKETLGTFITKLFRKTGAK